MIQDKEEDKIELRSEEFQEIRGTVPSWILRRGISLLAIIVTVLLIGSTFFKYPDTILTTMTLTGTTPAAALIAKPSGKLQELDVTDKQSVMLGDYLAVIENPAKTKDVQTLKQYILGLNGKIDTLINLPPKELHLGAMQSVYIPPNWQKWNKHSALKQKFLEYFNYAI
ncbi:MAG: hypothetical protein LBL79_04930 [Prevotella sp.]|jgi:HlyD family secretion protein|nr:hypothetical protein [Prevotella sp.]